MRNLLNPKWLLIVNTLPILLLFFLGYTEYRIICSLLKPETKELWAFFAISLGLLGLLHFGYSIYLIKSKKNIPVGYAFIALIVFILYLYGYMWNATDLIPLDIPRWMQSGNILIYGGTFLMPTFAFSLFVIVVKLTSETGRRSAVKSFLSAVAVPVLFFVFYHIAGSLWRITGTDLGIHFMVIFTIAGTSVFLYFLIKTIYIVAHRNDKFFVKYKLAWMIPITILLPLLGLAINNGFSFLGIQAGGMGGTFGDFTNKWFYILAIINGVLLCLPESNNKIYRLLLFFGRCITFSFTFYFFLVFLPFLPLSVIAIVAIGTGFLMLVPLLLFVIHIRELSRDMDYISLTGSNPLLLLIVGVLTIPLIITFNNIHHKSVLAEAMQYVYEPDYAKDYDIDTISLTNTLNTILDYKENRSFSITNVKIPYLSSYYNWIVLNNMTLSDKKIQTLEKIFLGSSDIRVWEQSDIESNDVRLSGIKHYSIYNSTKKQWESTIDFEITNFNGTDFGEYETTLTLPDGCWISDYYLHVGDRKEKGILAEKKAATWIYSQIRNENRDPGILYYTGNNRVAFKVFPFAKDEVRKTGISFIHKEQVELNIDGNKLLLGDNSKSDSIDGKDVVYISVKEKAKLEQVKRKPYFHFIIDASSGSTARTKEQVNIICDNIISGNQIGASAQSKFTFANTFASPPYNKEEMNKLWNEQKFKGGFYAERAIKKVLLESHKNNSSNYPVIMLVTDSISSAIIEKDFSGIEFAFPDNKWFYVVNGKQLTKHSLVGLPKEVSNDTNGIVPGETVLTWPAADKPKRYISNDSLPEIILLDEYYTAADNVIKERDWNTALAMQAEYMALALHPEKTNEEWLRQVKHSFVSKVMSPHTSYIVVENEAQKAALRKKQEQVLSGSQSLDLSEDEQRMSEPGLFLLLVILLLAFVIKRKYTFYRINMKSSKIKS